MYAEQPKHGDIFEVIDHELHIDCGMVDAEVADAIIQYAIIQYAIFSEIFYGQEADYGGSSSIGDFDYLGHG